MTAAETIGRILVPVDFSPHSDKALRHAISLARSLTGRPSHVIVEHAKSGAFDLIVMGTHGRTVLSHALMGSVAERVVRRAPCPVLTVRSTETTVNTQPSIPAEAVA